jgi:hypothetical protein
MFLGPKAIPKSFATWSEDLKDIFVLRGKITENSDDLEELLREIIRQQATLAETLETLPFNLRKAALIPRYDKAGHPDIPLLPVINSISIIQVEMCLMHPLKVLMQPTQINGFDFARPLMSERGLLTLSIDHDSRPGSAFNSRHSSSQQLTPREPDIDLSIYQGPAALVQFKMKTKEEIFTLCGIGGNPKPGDDKGKENFVPLHPSIGLNPLSNVF